MAVRYLPPQWGPTLNSQAGNTNLDYQLLMRADDPLTSPIDLTGHAITGMSAERQEALKADYIERVNGQNVSRRSTIRQGQVLEWTFTLGHGSKGAIWTPTLQKSFDSTLCPTDFFQKKNCSPNADEAHAWIYHDVIIDESEPASDPVVITGGEVVTQQSPCTSTKRSIMYGIGAYPRPDGTQPYYDVTFLSPDCPGCGAIPNSDLVAVGGDGSSTMLVAKSSDRGGTVEELDTSAFGAGIIGNTVVNQGSVLVIGYSDDVLASATDGGVAVSVDLENLVEATVDTSFGPIWGASAIPGLFMVVGGPSGGQSTAFISVDGSNYEEIESANLPATQAALAVAADPDTGAFYVVGEGGLCLKGQISGEGFVFTALTPTNIGSDDLFSVHVFAKDFIGVGGEDGYFAISTDGGSTWLVPTTNAGTNTVHAIAGDRYRLVIGADDQIGMADILSNFAFENIVLKNAATLTGPVRGIAMSKDQKTGFNYFAIVSADAAGELLVAQPAHPNA